MRDPKVFTREFCHSSPSFSNSNAAIVQPARIKENMEVTDFDLADEDIAAISGMNQNLRFNDPADMDPRCAIFA